MLWKILGLKSDSRTSFCFQENLNRLLEGVMAFLTFQNKSIFSQFHFLGFWGLLQTSTRQTISNELVLIKYLNPYVSINSFWEIFIDVGILSLKFRK